MNILKITAGALSAALLFAVLAPTVSAQYYVPLRYDMRYGSPAYIPSTGYPNPYGYGPPPRQDPYAFGSLWYQDLGLTGNLRAGKSFQGNIPFNQQGSQLSITLPSLALSNFTRDSVGLGDVGTGVVYGLATPYFPGSASVTNLYTAQTRFASPPPTARAPYTLPNLNSALPGYPQPLITTTYSPAAPLPPGTSPAAPPMEQPRPPGLYVPQAAVEWVNALIEGRVPTPKTTNEEGAVQGTETRLGLPIKPIDQRLGLPQTPEAKAEAGKKAEAERKTEAEKKAAAEAEDRAIKDSESALYWMIRGEAARQRQTTPGAITPVPQSPGPAARAPGGPSTEEKVMIGTEEEQPPPLPFTPQPYVPVTNFADYVERAHAAMKRYGYSQAEALYAAAQALDSDRPSAAFGRVYALLGDRQYGQAVLVVDRILRAHPDWAKSVPDIKAVYPKPEVFDRIIADLKEEIERKPDVANTAFLLGYVYFAAGQNDDARLYLKHVAAVRGKEPGPEKVLLDVMGTGK